MPGERLPRHGGLSARDVAKKVVVALGLATLGSGAVYLNLRLAAARGGRTSLELGLVRLEGAATVVVFLLILLVVLHTVPQERCSNSSSRKSCGTTTLGGTSRAGGSRG